jgi:hypothetical protein
MTSAMLFRVYIKAWLVTNVLKLNLPDELGPKRDFILPAPRRRNGL